MVRGEYTFHHPEDINKKHDSSWKSVVCALLTFGTICLIIVALTVPWKSVGRQQEGNNSNEATYDTYKDEQSAEVFNEKYTTTSDKYKNSHQPHEHNEPIDTNLAENDNDKTESSSENIDDTNHDNDDWKDNLDNVHQPDLKDSDNHNNSENHPHKSNEPIDSNSVEKNENINDNNDITKQHKTLLPSTEAPDYDTKNNDSNYNLNNVHQSDVKDSDNHKDDDDNNGSKNNPNEPNKPIEKENTFDNRNDSIHNNTDHETLLPPIVIHDDDTRNNESNSNLNNVHQSDVKDSDNHKEDDSINGSKNNPNEPNKSIENENTFDNSNDNNHNNTDHETLLPPIVIHDDDTINNESNSNLNNKQQSDVKDSDNHKYDSNNGSKNHPNEPNKSIINDNTFENSKDNNHNNTDHETLPPTVVPDDDDINNNGSNSNLNNVHQSGVKDSDKHKEEDDNSSKNHHNETSKPIDYNTVKKENTYEDSNANNHNKTLLYPTVETDLNDTVAKDSDNHSDNHKEEDDNSSKNYHNETSKPIDYNTVKKENTYEDSNANNHNKTLLYPTVETDLNDTAAKDSDNHTENQLNKPIESIDSKSEHIYTADRKKLLENTDTNCTCLSDKVQFDNYKETNINSTMIINKVYENCPTEVTEANICQSTLCKNTASKILSLMDHDAKPCNNFYLHACHGISNDYTVEINRELKIKKYISEKIEEIDLNSPHYQQVFKNFFTTCKKFNVTETCFANIKSLVSSVGVYCNKDDSSSNNLPPMTNLVTELLKRNIPIFFDLVTETERDTLKFIIAIKPVSYQKIISNIMENPYNKFCMEEIKTNKKKIDLYKDSYEVYNKCENSLDEFIRVTTNTLKNMNVFYNAKESIKDVINTTKTIFNHINEIMPTQIEFDNAYEDKNIAYFTLDELNEKFKPFDWTYVFDELFGNFTHQNEKILVYFPDKLKAIFDILCRVHPRSMHNTILTLYTHQLFRTYIQDQNVADRNSYCMDLSIKLMEDVGSYLYIKSIPSEKVTADNTELHRIFDYIKTTLESEIKISKWIAGRSEKIKSAVNKLKILTLQTFNDYNLKTMNNDLENCYKDVASKGEFVLFGDILQNRIRTFMYSVYKRVSIDQQSMWFYLVNPLSTEIKTVGNRDIIVAPLGSINRDTLLTELPYYLIMSDIGFQIAKQMNNYLQIQKYELGKYEAQKGPIKLSVRDIINDQEINLKMDLELTLKERITDATGAELALISYRRSNQVADKPLPWLGKTPEQLYYFNLVQQFCTKRPIQTYMSMFDKGKTHPMFKANSIAINTLRFTEIFKCPIDIDMEGSIKITLPSDEY